MHPHPQHQAPALVMGSPRERSPGAACATSPVPSACAATPGLSASAMSLPLQARPRCPPNVPPDGPPDNPDRLPASARFTTLSRRGRALRDAFSCACDSPMATADSNPQSCNVEIHARSRPPFFHTASTTCCINRVSLKEDLASEGCCCGRVARLARHRLTSSTPASLFSSPPVLPPAPPSATPSVLLTIKADINTRGLRDHVAAKEFANLKKSYLTSDQ
jgi:hypothetical protein